MSIEIEKPKLRFDVFISYKWDNKPDVERLKEYLTIKGITAWMDCILEPGESLSSEIQAAIDASGCFLSCITKGYCNSDYCRNELNYAVKLKKPIIPLMLENLKMNELINGVGLLISEKIQLNAYNERNWSGELGEQILKAIQKSINLNNTTEVNLPESTAANEEKLFYMIVFLGNPNSGKSSLIRKILENFQENQSDPDVTSYPQFDEHQKFEFYFKGKLVFVDVGGLCLTNSDELKLVEETLEYAKNSEEKIKLKLQERFPEKVSNAANFIFTYIMMSSNGNILNDHQIIINYLSRVKKEISWLYVISKFDEREEYDETAERFKDLLETKEIYKKQIFEKFGKIQTNILEERLFFISLINNDEIKKEYNDFEKLQKYICEDSLVKRESINFNDYFVNISVTGAGNIGKSTLVNKMLGSKRAETGEGFVTSQVKPYELFKYPFINIYDNPGNDGNNGVKLHNFATNLNLIILVIKDSPTNEDCNIIKQIEILKKIRIFNQGLDKESVEVKKENRKSKILTRLALPTDTPFYCISSKRGDEKQPWNKDLKDFLPEKIEDSPWFKLSLTKGAQCRIDLMNIPFKEEKIKKIKEEMEKDWNNLKKVFNSFLNILPFLGDIYENRTLQSYIRKYAPLLNLGDYVFHIRTVQLKEELKNSETRVRLENIIERYSVINESCKVFFEDALFRASKKHKILYASTAGIRLSKLFSDFLRTTSKYTAKVGYISSGVLKFLKVTSTRFDDIAWIVTEAGAKIFCSIPALAAATVTSLAMAAYGGAYLHFMFNEINQMLIEDAEFIHILKVENKK